MAFDIQEELKKTAGETRRLSDARRGRYNYLRRKGEFRWKNRVRQYFQMSRNQRAED